MDVKNMMYPNISSVPSQSGSSVKKSDPGHAQAGEFDQIFEEQIQSPSLKFSAHASQRLKDRNISMDPSMMAKVRDAVDKAESKGVEDTLVLTPNAALIVNVKNRTVITALDRSSLSGNVFTHIDGAVIV